MSPKTATCECSLNNVHTQIKDMCKEARNRMGLTNQNISDLICERFGFDDFSVNTVNNFFSERSKASTISTIGYICSVLSVSVDKVFGIEQKLSSEEEADLLRKLSDTEAELRFKEQEISNLHELINEKDQRLEQAHEALDHYRAESHLNRFKVHPGVFIITVSLLVCALLFIVIYLMTFDAGNPDFGILGR